MQITQTREKLQGYIEREQFKGYDPYDALNSPLLKMLTFNQKFSRLVVIQVFKRLPINLRPLFFVRKGHNPKGLGLFLWGYTKLYSKYKRKEFLNTIEILLDLLEQNISSNYSGNCWGYNFDWQSSVVWFPQNTPTVVNSSFIGHALLDTYNATGKDRALKMALSIKDFIVKDLNRTTENGRICFSYSPSDQTVVHNANLLGASLLIRLSTITKDNSIRNIALSSLDYSMHHQRTDGAWYYAETKKQKWIDSYHTGFNLQSLLYFENDENWPLYQEKFERGVEFYAANFFLEDGTPKFYHNSVYPVDIHAPSEAIVFFSRMGNKYKPLVDRILNWMLRNMFDKKGYFYYQKRKYFTNRIPYIRWSQAWAFHALTEYEFQFKGS